MRAYSPAPHIESKRLLRTLWLALLVISCHAACNAQSAVISSVGELSGYHIPFSYDPLLQPEILVQVSLNGQAPLPFVVDTGLFGLPLIVDTRVAEQLNLTPDPQSKPQELGSMQVRPAHLDSFAFVTSRSLRPDEVVPVPGFDSAFVGDLGMVRSLKSGRQQAAGIIGVDMLMLCAVQFDFDSHVMTVYPKPHAPIQIPGATVLPMSQHKDSSAYYIRMTLQEGITTELLVDTGAEGTDIPMSIAQRLQPLAAVSSGTGTFYGLWITPTLLLPAVTLGTTTLTKVAVYSQPQLMPFFSLGIDLLSRFRVTLDFPNRRMLLQRRPDDAQRPHLDGYAGINLLQQGSDYVVEGVDAGSPAWQAGIRSGDVVTDIDGHGVAGLPAITAQALLNGFANTKAQMVVKREGGNSTKVSFDRLSVFARPPAAIDGLILQIPTHQPMQVIGLIKGYAGERAGLRRGDVILEFNGRPTTDIDTNTLVVEYKKRLLTLKVQRKGVVKPFLVTVPPRR